MNFGTNWKEQVVALVKSSYDSPLLKTWRIKDINAGMRFRDGSLEVAGNTPSVLPMDSSEFEWDWVQQDASIEGVPYTTINIQQKIASILFNIPDLHIVLKQGYPDGLDKIVGSFLRNLYEANEWKFVLERTLLKRFLSGSGIMAVLWNDEAGVLWEQVSIRDLAFDPNVIRFDKLRWAARRVLIPKDEARERFPKIRSKLSVTGGKPPLPSSGEAKTSRKDMCAEIWVYWDDQREVHIYEDEVIEDAPNLYGRVPLWFLHGDADPNSVIYMGDYDLVYGMQVKYEQMISLLFAQATHGGPITSFDPDAFDNDTVEKLQNGVPNQWITVKPAMLDDAIRRVPAEPVNPNLVAALSKTENLIDSSQGVDQYQRGVIENPAKTATEAALTAQLRGARANKQKAEFERYISRLFQETARQFSLFSKPETEEDWILHQCIGAIETLSVIEDSMVFKDPQAQLNTAVTLIQQALPLVQMGVPINLEALWKKLLRATGETNTDEYLMATPPMAPAPPMAGNVPMAQGGQPQAQGGMPPAPPEQNPPNLPFTPQGVQKNA